MSDWVVVVVCAVVWWVPTFTGLSDLQQHERLPRPVVWKWTAVLAVPVIGPVLYFRRGRPALAARKR